MLTKHDKRILAVVATLFAISYGISLMQEYNNQHSVAYADSFMIYGIESIDYERNSPSGGQTRGKIESITLKGKSTIQHYKKSKTYD